MKNSTPQEIWKAIKESKRILMTLHSMPDGDSIGSCTAFKRIIEQNTKAKATLVSYDPINRTILSLLLAEDVLFEKDITDFKMDDFDLFLALGTSEVSRLGKTKPKFSLPKNLKTINIDHHHTNTYFGNLNYVLSDFPSCCSILSLLFKDLKIKIDEETATRLLLGICTDTSFFTYPNSKSAIKDAAELIDLGAKYIKGIVSPILHNQPLNLKKYFALLITKLKINKEKN